MIQGAPSSHFSFWAERYSAGWESVNPWVGENGVNVPNTFEANADLSHFVGILELSSHTPSWKAFQKVTFQKGPLWLTSVCEKDFFEYKGRR